ncbi:hypothetical protein LPL04_17280 [Klebsiella pneumoniae]|jgi:hypothetical protein|uniref:Apea-like HEPN domain-containing protein n=7 Tax=Klebsiella pneumoniae complex TaxID=3390273 RepID=A0A9P3PC30_KLEVA|nr:MULTISPECIES: HEPN domain-containing protein [Klebsiella]UYM68079.1 HEPN domain-containing protein [Escherichia coli]VED51411.1 Uncharacterised protein [Klebsiella aerogenes]AMA32818.1 hypothetical protein RJF9_26055 [Klebsiella pneumoniae subsp. pneumoniae]AOE28661.1 hypothetical protein BCV48_25645 [Klebsiella pneumoniae]AOE33780.1 hypothetical protein BCV49_26925 [Klebsiella pneumoniae]
MSASLDDVKDFDFVISEAFRIDVGLDSPNFREFYNQEYNRDFGSIGMTINAPIELISKNRTIPQRQIHLSYASNERLHLISARFIKSNRLEMLVTVDEFVENIKKSLYVHTFIDDGDDGIKGYTQLLNKALKKTKREMIQEDFFFPILAHGLDKEKICIGRAEIISAQHMYSMINDNLTEEQILLSRRFCSAHKYHYGHFLRIPVSKRSKKSRERIAKNIAGFVVGILQLFSEHYHISPDFLSLSTSPYPNYEGFYFTRTSNNDFNYNHSSKGRITWSDKFWDKFESDYNSDLGEVLSRLIDLAIEPNERTIIADRLIDAIYLFSSAQQDKDDSSRIVKLATALERLVSLPSEKKDESTTKNFVSRVSSLVSIYYPDEKDWAKVSKEMYEIRSNITHGAWSLYRGVDPLYSSRYSELTSRAIFSACIGFYKRSFTSDNNDRLVKEFFDFLENAIKEK